MRSSPRGRSPREGAGSHPLRRVNGFYEIIRETIFNSNVMCGVRMNGEDWRVVQGVNNEIRYLGVNLTMEELQYTVDVPPSGRGPASS